MQASRRNFLSQCLGGAALSLAPIAAAKAASLDTSPKQSALECCAIHLETDFTPNGTHVRDVNGNKLVALDELLVEFHDNGPPWVGMGLVVIEPSGLESPPKKDELFCKLTPSDGRLWPDIGTHDGRHLPVTVMECSREDSLITRAFVCGPMPIKHAPVDALNIEFLVCGTCQAVERRLRIAKDDLAFANTGWSPAKDFDSIDRPCPRCMSWTARESFAGRAEDLYKLYMTPQSCHLVFHHGDRPEVKPAPHSLLPVGLELNQRAMWFLQHLDRSPVAQISPKPNILNDVILRSFGSMLRG